MDPPDLLNLARSAVTFFPKHTWGVGWLGQKVRLFLMRIFVPQTPFPVQILVNFGGEIFLGKIKGYKEDF